MYFSLTYQLYTMSKLAQLYYGRTQESIITSAKRNRTCPVALPYPRACIVSHCFDVGIGGHDKPSTRKKALTASKSSASLTILNASGLEQVNDGSNTTIRRNKISLLSKRFQLSVSLLRCYKSYERTHNLIFL